LEAPQCLSHNALLLPNSKLHAYRLDPSACLRSSHSPSSSRPPPVPVTPLVSPHPPPPPTRTPNSSLVRPSACAARATPPPGSWPAASRTISYMFPKPGGATRSRFEGGEYQASDTAALPGGPQDGSRGHGLWRPARLAAAVLPAGHLTLKPPSSISMPGPRPTCCPNLLLRHCNPPSDRCA
jgi:hypothetical protein